MGLSGYWGGVLCGLNGERSTGISGELYHHVPGAIARYFLDGGFVSSGQRYGRFLWNGGRSHFGDYWLECGMADLPWYLAVGDHGSPGDFAGLWDLPAGSNSAPAIATGAHPLEPNPRD